MFLIQILVTVIGGDHLPLPVLTRGFPLGLLPLQRRGELVVKLSEM